MSELLKPFMGSPDEYPRRPYDPFPSARDSGKVDLDALNIRQLHVPLSVVLTEGRKPQPNDAGVVAIGEDEIFAVDLIRLLHADYRQIVIGPSSKDAVDKHSGRIQDEGVVSINFLDGRVYYVGGAIDTASKPWQANRLGVPWRSMGGLAIVQFGLDAIKHEISDIDAKTGQVKTIPRRRYW